MAISIVKAEFPCGIEKVWDVVSSLEHYAWRSDLSRIEVVEPGRKFIEYTNDGFSTTFTITVFEPFERYEFDMENDNMSGHWSGVFSFKDGVTSIVFTEDVTAKKWIMRPFVGGYLKKMQSAYMADLKRELMGR